MPAVGTTLIGAWGYPLRLCIRGGHLLTDDEYRAVFDASPDGCLVVEADGTIRGANRRVQDLFGWPPDELVGQPIEVLVPESRRARHVGQRGTFMADPHTRPMGVGLDLEARRKDGSTFPVEISLSPWRERGEEMRVICTVRDVTEYRRLRTFSARALQASEEERRRISRELHDDIAQRLATLVLSVKRLAEERDVESRRMLGESVREDVVQTSDAVRFMARGLRPPELEEVGLSPAIAAHVRRMREATGFRIETDLDLDDGSLDLAARLAIYRIVQEALSNAVKHSGAESASIRMYSTDDALVAEVADAGRGFIVPSNVSGSGLGVIGMEERAEMMGGQLTIDSHPDRGTTVKLTVPHRPSPGEDS